MSLIKTIRGFTPQFGEGCFLAENATIIGDVIMGDQCSVWFNAVVRGDVNYIRIGNMVNIQDGAIIHGTFETALQILGTRSQLHIMPLCMDVLLKITYWWAWVQSSWTMPLSAAIQSLQPVR
jgi:hypothetical protein